MLKVTELGAQQWQEIDKCTVLLEIGPAEDRKDSQLPFEQIDGKEPLGSGIKALFLN